MANISTKTFFVEIFRGAESLGAANSGEFKFLKNDMARDWAQETRGLRKSWPQRKDRSSQFGAGRRLEKRPSGEGTANNSNSNNDNNDNNNSD